MVFVFQKKESGLPITLGVTATKNKTQGKVSPVPMKNGFGNESTREKVLFMIVIYL